jgi:chromosome segregation ATPase
MGEADRKDLKAKLAEFSHRLETLTRAFATQGELSDQHRSLMNEIERHRDRIQSKLDRVEAGGAPWDVVKAETEGELDSLSDKLTLLDESLDADEMKHLRN